MFLIHASTFLNMEVLSFLQPQDLFLTDSQLLCRKNSVASLSALRLKEDTSLNFELSKIVNENEEVENRGAIGITVNVTEAEGEEEGGDEPVESEKETRGGRNAC